MNILTAIILRVVLAIGLLGVLTLITSTLVISSRISRREEDEIENVKE